MWKKLLWRQFYSLSWVRGAMACNEEKPNYLKDLPHNGPKKDLKAVGKKARTKGGKKAHTTEFGPPRKPK